MVDAPLHRGGIGDEICNLQAIGFRRVVKPKLGALETPPPQYEVEIEKGVCIPMRDGVRLAADLYQPRGVGERLPCILIRTPYNKDTEATVRDGRFFAGRGFAVVIADFRGRYHSEGVYRFTRGHREDGYDTCAWIVAQSWCSGKIGTYGCSYLGEVQLYQAPSRPPGLTAMIPQASGSAVGSAGGYFHCAQDLGGGIWGLSMLFDWWYQEGSQLYFSPRPGQPVPKDPIRAAAVAQLFRTGPEMPSIDYESVLRTLPIIDMMERVTVPPNEWAEFVRHNLDLTDPWWRQFDYVSDDTDIDLPTLFIENWNDYTSGAALYLRNHLEQTAATERARRHQYIIVAPGSHCSVDRQTANEYVGDLFAGDPRFGHRDIYLKWFDFWLRDQPNGITEMPKIQYYLLGENTWKACDRWPVPNTQYRSFYLSSDGHANGDRGDGTLIDTPPTSAEPDGYSYDPEDPAPTLGTDDYFMQSKPITDQRPLSARKDVLVYTSAPLEKGLEMTGEPEVVLYVSSSAKDTDFMAKLVDVYPDGRALNVREGALRARYRNGRDRPAVLMNPGDIYTLRLKLGAYSLYFAAGHRVRLQITSSSFPRYERNLNTGGNNFDESQGVVAHNRIHHDQTHPSRLVLPVVSE